MCLLGTHQIQTTAYYLIANGLVEHLHCQLKGATICLLYTTHWTKALPFILLGKCTTFRQDHYCTAAECSVWHYTQIVRRFLALHPQHPLS